MALLEVKDLTAAYGGIQALRGVSLKVEEGQIVAVLGANGAGKSTLLKCISSVMTPTGGTIEFLGQPVSQKPYEVVEAGLVQVPEARQIFAKLTVAENLRVGSGLRKDTDGIRRDLERVYTMFPRLKEREKQYGGLLSGGEQQMLAIGRGIMAKPKLMMLDEPSLGLAPVIVTQVFDIIKEINQEGMAIMLIEQNAQKVLEFCDQAYIMQVGKVAISGKGRDLLEDNAVAKMVQHNHAHPLGHIVTAKYWQQVSKPVASCSFLPSNAKYFIPTSARCTLPKQPSGTSLPIA